MSSINNVERFRKRLEANEICVNLIKQSHDNEAQEDFSLSRELTP